MNSLNIILDSKEINTVLSHPGLLNDEERFIIRDIPEDIEPQKIEVNSIILSRGVQILIVTIVDDLGERHDFDRLGDPLMVLIGTAVDVSSETIREVKTDALVSDYVLEELYNFQTYKSNCNL